MKCIGSNLLRKLREKKGSAGLTWTLVWVLVIIIVLAVAMEFFRGYIILKGIQDAMQNSIISVAADNSYNAFSGLRESNSTLYTYDYAGLRMDGTFWDEIMRLTDIQQHMVRNYGCEAVGTSLVHTTSGRADTEYTISGIAISVQNPNVSHLGDPTSFKITATYTVRLPLTFLGDIPVPLNIPQELNCKWKPRFG